MSIFSGSELIRPSQYTKTEGDILYNSMIDYLYSQSVLNLANLGYMREEVGKDGSCEYLQLFYWQALVSYLIKYKFFLSKVCVGNKDSLDQFKKDWKIDCIRNTVLCRYNKTKHFDKLLELAGVNSLDGLDNMVLGGDNNICTSDFII